MSSHLSGSRRALRLILLGLFAIVGNAVAAGYQSIDFGSANVGTTSSSQIITFTGLAAQPTFSVRYGSDFTVTDTTCDSGWNTCTVTATFSPTYPGLRQDAVVAKDAGSNVLSTAYLHGIGLAPQITLGHGKIIVRKPAAFGQQISNLAVDPGGNIYYTTYNSFPVINKLAVGSSTPQTVVGRSFVPGGFTENTPGTNVYLGSTGPFTIDAAGNLFFSAAGRICKLDSVTNLVTTVAGGGSAFTFADGDSATSLASISPNSLAVDLFGNLYISVYYEIYRVDLNSRTIYHFAGTGRYGTIPEDDGPATAANINARRITVDRQGNLFLLDSFNGIIRKVIASTGIIQKPFVGGGTVPPVEGSLAADAYFGSFLNSMASDAYDNLYLFSMDYYGSVIWKVDRVSGILTRVAGKFSGFVAAEGIDSDVVGFSINSLAIDAAGNILLAQANSALLSISATEGYVVFPNPQPGDTAAPQLLTITNSGNQSLQLVLSQFVSGRQWELLTTNSCSFPGTLAAGGRCTVLVGASEAGAIAAGSLEITSNSLNAVSTVNSFSLQIGFPQATLQSSTLSFTATAIADSQYGNVALSNTGGKVSLGISNTSLSGTNAADFFLSTSFCSSVSPESQCNLHVTFRPTAVGTRTATLTIVSNAAASPQTVTLTGTGLPRPSLAVAPAALNFGNQVVGQSSAAQTVVVTNTGNPDIVLDRYYTYYLNSAFFISTDTCVYANYLLHSGQSCSVSIQLKPSSTGSIRTTLPFSGTGSRVSVSGAVSLSGFGVAKPNTRFVAIAPCRIIDTRNPVGPFGGPSLAAQGTRDLDVPGSACGIPANAVAYSLNATVVPDGPLSWLTIWPTGQAKPLVSTLNSFDGRIKANAAIVPAGANGHINLFATDKTDVILDTNGYFVQVTDDSALAFFPVAPCRIMDTRVASGLLGGPFLAARQERAIPVLTSGCGIPTTAKAYSLNFTVVPQTPLDYLTVWPSGQTRPLVSTLNAPTATVVANAAIVPAGQAGNINVFATNNTDLIVDVNGYFAPMGPGGLSLNTVTPCRVFDSRETSTRETINGALAVALVNSCNLPAEAQAVVSNATVVPSGAMNYLTLWPSGQPQPTVSTLNAFDAAVTSNMAIVPTSSGSISAFTAGRTHLILDVSGYFAP